jgi:hypothetical protein
MIECIKADGVEFVCDMEPTSATILVLSANRTLPAVVHCKPLRDQVWNITGVLTSFCMLGLKASAVKTLHHDRKQQKMLAQESGYLVASLEATAGGQAAVATDGNAPTPLLMPTLLSPRTGRKVAEQLASIMQKRRSTMTHGSPFRGFHGVPVVPVDPETLPSANE